MKKVGLITFHKSINYGVFLQAYAIQEAVQSLSAEASIIEYNRFTSEDYVGKKKSIIYRLIHLNQTLSAVKLLFFRKSSGSLERIEKFEKFSEEYLKLGEKADNFNDLLELNEKYDYFVCGSDQVWNPEYTKANKAYFLTFAAPEKRISYAASYGVDRLEVFETYKNQYEQMLKELVSLSVRETSAAEITKELCGRTPQVVVDPTLLLSKEKWTSMEKNPLKDNNEYVLFYVLGNDKRYVELAKKIAKKGIKVIVIPNGPIWKRQDNIDLIYAGVEEFLYLINHATYVYTDSFHGAAFSVNFNKNFTALKREDTKYSLFSRLEDFLKKIGLSACCSNIDSAIKNIQFEKVDYTEANENLSKWIIESKKFLESSLSRQKDND